jgi:hypothetical protein
MDISVDIDKDYRLAVWDNEEKICASFHYRDLDKHDGESFWEIREKYSHYGLEEKKDPNICEQCYMNGASDELHSCPYSDGMGGLEKKCNCCSSCVAQCEYEI